MMISRWWRSLGFYWQLYLIMIGSFGGIITLVEAVAEPLLLKVLEERFQLAPATSEIIMWIAGVLAPTLVLGSILTQMVVHKNVAIVKMAKRLSCGDLTTRIETTGNENDVFNQLALVFNNMAGSLENVMTNEKRLLTDISHELRSPLTRMSVATALLSIKREPEEIAAMAKILDAEIDHMNKQVAILLEQGRNRLREQEKYGRVDLSALTRDVVAMHSLVANANKKSINASIVPDIGIWGHPARLRMILDNILSNALFYSPPNGSVEVCVSQEKEKAILSVRDQGPGVPEKHLQDIFRAFFRIDESRARSSGGVGLGLALARDATIAMGGVIEARNLKPGLEVIVAFAESLELAEKKEGTTL